MVEFHSIQDAQNAIATLHDSELDGRKLLVREDREDGQKPQQAPQKKKRDRGSDDVVVVGKKLYVGNLNYQTTWQQLKDHFKDCGKRCSCGCQPRLRDRRVRKSCGCRFRDFQEVEYRARRAEDQRERR